MLFLTLTVYRIRYILVSGRHAPRFCMAKAKKAEKTTPKPLAWLHGEIKTPPFTEEGRKLAGYLLRLLQQGAKLRMPQAEALPPVGPRCGALRIRDGAGN